MPTENRSSNTEMVSDSEMTECQFHNNCGGWCETRRELEHNLCEHCLEAHDEEMASPAQQHKVEPVAWIYSRPEGQVEPVVLLKRASEGDRGSWDETPLYIHADPGEVERLRAEIRSLRQHKTEYMEAAEETRKALLAQLAELESSVREFLRIDGLSVDGSAARNKALKMLAAALSASAEPSACQRCAGTGIWYPATGSNERQRCPEGCAPVERDELPAFAQKVLKKLRRTQECFEDGQGTDVGREWLDILVKLGLLNRVQRSPALWEISDAGDAFLDARAALERKP